MFAPIRISPRCPYLFYFPCFKFLRLLSDEHFFRLKIARDRQGATKGDPNLLQTRMKNHSTSPCHALCKILQTFRFQKLSIFPKLTSSQNPHVSKIPKIQHSPKIHKFPKFTFIHSRHELKKPYMEISDPKT